MVFSLLNEISGTYFHHHGSVSPHQRSRHCAGCRSLAPPGGWRVDGGWDCRAPAHSSPCSPLQMTPCNTKHVVHTT